MSADWRLHAAWCIIHAKRPMICKRAAPLLTSFCDPHRISGKAAFGLGKKQQSVISYRKAVKLNDAAAPAWMGLAEVANSGADALLAIEAYERLVRASDQEPPMNSQLSLKVKSIVSDALLCNGYLQVEILGGSAETETRARDYELQLIDEYEKAGRHADAARRIQQAIKQDDAASAAWLCRLADNQVHHIIGEQVGHQLVSNLNCIALLSKRDRLCRRRNCQTLQRTGLRHCRPLLTRRCRLPCMCATTMRCCSTSMPAHLHHQGGQCWTNTP